LIVRYLVKEGDEVKENDRIAILEAMKMENEITAPVSGKIKALTFKDGDRVKKEEIIAVIGRLHG
jgi:biotin carboxyl carrier protein